MIFISYTRPNVAAGLMPALVDAPAENPFVANWSAKGHTLCLGHWIITYQGLPLALPSKQADNHMHTFGIFSWLDPDDEDYAEGLLEPQWIEKNAEWLLTVFDLHHIEFDESHLHWFYEAVNVDDWRCGSCGGCI